jgi:sulfide:quinone oxidoreductase
LREVQQRPNEPEPFEVIIAGGGVAALEALLYLGEELERAPRLKVALLSRAEEFTVRPLSVAQPFDRARPPRVELAGLCERLGVEYIHDGVSEVWGDRQRLLTDSGEEIFYDALLLSIGAEQHGVLPGSLLFRDGRDAPALAEIVAELGRGRHIVFAIPPEVRWSLPAYELALLSAEQAAEGGRVTLLTHEREALEALGGHGSRRVAELAAQAGVELICGRSALRFNGEALELAGDGQIEADHVVSLPRLSVASIPGLNQGRRGFIGTDPWMRADGVRSVWAAGDATWFPIKQGGLATQQAEVAVGGILAAAGLGPEPEPFRPVLRGTLLTGDRAEFFRGEPDTGESEMGSTPLWYPPGKLVGRRLAPFLAGEGSGLPTEARPQLREGADQRTEADHRDVLGLVLASADADARAGEHETALRWLQIAETLNVSLPPEYVERRRDWERAAGG